MDLVDDRGEYMTYEHEDFLAHYGVKGQKWGVRNYQNPDGTLIHPKGRKKKNTQVPESDTWRKDESKWLSDDELNRRNNRMQREQQYRQNIDNRHPVKKEAINAAKKILLYSAIGIATAMATKKYKSIAEKGAEFLKNRKTARAMSQSVRSIINRRSRWVL